MSRTSSVDSDGAAGSTSQRSLPVTRPRAQAASEADVAVVIVSWNNRRYLEPCLDSLFGGRVLSRFEVVVVDNGSTDGSQELLRERFPSVGLIQNARNVGLGRASNQGIAATTARYVLLLNDDTVVNGPSIDALVRFMNVTPRAGAVGGRVLNVDGTVQSCYNAFPTLAEEFLIATRVGEAMWPGYPANVDAQHPRAVDWMTSAFLMLRREALVEVGGLDEDYFIYGDEVDLQYRLNRADWGVHFIPEAEIVHYGGRSLDRWKRRRMVYRGKILFYKKHYGLLRTTLLRAVLGGLTALKLCAWAPAYLSPRHRRRVTRELQSNLEVIGLCWRPE